MISVEDLIKIPLDFLEGLHRDGWLLPAVIILGLGLLYWVFFR